jgi:hypothetical protein
LVLAILITGPDVNCFDVITRKKLLGSWSLLVSEGEFWAFKGRFSTVGYSFCFNWKSMVLLTLRSVLRRLLQLQGFSLYLLVGKFNEFLKFLFSKGKNLKEYVTIL